MEGVILCTEQGYDEKALEAAVKAEFKTTYQNSYVEMISKIVEELLIEGKVNKLQTFGYTYDRGGLGPNTVGGG